MTATTTDRQLVGIVLAIVAALVIVSALAMGFGAMGTGWMMGGGVDHWMADHGMWGGGDGPTGWALVVGATLQVLFLALLVGAGALGYRALTSPERSADPALAELRSAYARGEIDDEAFERRRERLGADR